MSEKSELETTMFLRAIVALMIDARSRVVAPADGAPPIEVVLAGAGLDYQTVASFVGKKPDAVRMMLARNASKSGS
jgi:hypothetical protein